MVGYHWIETFNAGRGCRPRSMLDDLSDRVSDYLSNSLQDPRVVDLFNKGTVFTLIYDDGSKPIHPIQVDSRKNIRRPQAELTIGNEVVLRFEAFPAPPNS